jgi:insulin-induced protein INSIG
MAFLKTVAWPVYLVKRACIIHGKISKGQIGVHLHHGRAILWLFLLGATLGTALDALHVYSHVERYARPVLFGLAWWVPLLFGAAAVAIGYSHPLVDPLIHNARPYRRLATSITELTWLLLAYLVAASPLDSIAKTGLLVLIYLNFWLLAGRGWQNLLLSFVTAITGTLVEMILVAAGAFSYVRPDIFGVPYWLPWIYACASLAVGDLGRSLMSISARGASS